MQNSACSEISPEGRVVTKALMNAAKCLGVSNTALGNIVGLSGASVTRMSKGEFYLQPKAKGFELAVLFLRMFRSLDAIVGGDDDAARKWLHNVNWAFGGGKPIDQIVKIEGLLHVIDYLDSRRAIT